MTMPLTPASSIIFPAVQFMSKMALASIRLEDVEEGKSKFEVILRLPSGPTVHRTALQREGVNVDVSSLIEVWGQRNTTHVLWSD